MPPEGQEAEVVSLSPPPVAQVSVESGPVEADEEEQEEDQMMILSPPPTVKRSGRNLVCDTCGAVGKYRCPGCKRESCSQECVAKHKEVHNCSGAREVQMVQAQEYDENTMKEDYFFLEKIGAAIQGYRKKVPHHEPFSVENLSTPLFYLREAAKTRGLHLTLLSRGMQRQSQNVTRFVAHSDTILWRVDFIIHNNYNNNNERIPDETGDDHTDPDTATNNNNNNTTTAPLKVCRLVNERFILQEVIDNLPLLRERKLKKHAVWNMHWEARRKRRNLQSAEASEPVAEGTVRGIVKKWDDKKGYGFISRNIPIPSKEGKEEGTDAGEEEVKAEEVEPLPDLFVHRNSLTGDGGSLTVGAEVLFDVVEGDKPRAENVSGAAVCPLGKAGKSLLARTNRKPRAPAAEETTKAPPPPEFGPGGRRPCDFFWRAGRCKHGDKCHFEHVSQSDVGQISEEVEPELRDQVLMSSHMVESDEQHRDLCAELEGDDTTMTAADEEERIQQKRKRCDDDILLDIMSPEEEVEEHYNDAVYDMEPPPVSHPPVVLSGYDDEQPIDVTEKEVTDEPITEQRDDDDTPRPEREKSRWAIAVDRMRDESRTPETRSALRQFVKDAKAGGGYRVMVRAHRLGKDVAYHELDRTATLAENLRKICYIVEYPTIDLFTPEEAATLNIITEEQLEQQRTKWQLTEKIPREKQPELTPDELRRMRKIPCKYFSMRGKCNNDVDCHFLHTYEKPYCKTLQNLGMCPLKERCFFSHTRYDPEDPENKRRIPRELRNHFVDYPKDRMRDVRDVAAEMEAREKGLPLPIPSDEPEWKRLQRERESNNNGGHRGSRTCAVRAPTPAGSIAVAAVPAVPARINPQKPQPVYPNRSAPQRPRPYTRPGGPNAPPGPVRVPPRY